MRLSVDGLEGRGGDRLLDVRGVAVVDLPAVPVARVQEDDLGGVNLSAVAPLPVIALPGVVHQASGDVDAVALSRDSAADGRIAPTGLRHPSRRTGLATFAAPGSPLDGL